ncbi:hypothetical protein RS3R2_23370 [Pseudomonas lactis]|nr:hypothetical protein RS3R2_23370 [Pseudomonas lactis]
MTTIAPQTAPPVTAPSALADNTPPPGDDLIRRKTQMLVDDGNLKASEEAIEHHGDPKKPVLMGNILTLETSDKSDVIHISQDPNGSLRVKVNEQEYTFNGNNPSPNSSSSEGIQPQFSLHIKSGAGNDNITLAPDVTVDVKIEAGDGDDTVQTEGGNPDIYGGRGNDTIRLGKGGGYVEGNDGDDTIIGGSGHSVMYGNKGNDRLYAGPGPANKKSHLDGGEGDDLLYAGDGHTVINGGDGNDQIVAYANTTAYTGKGSDTVWGNLTKARIYAQSSDYLPGTEQSTITRTEPSEAGKKAFKIVGPDEFKQRVEDDLALLRASPVGRKMLEEMDKAAERNGAPVTIEEDKKGGSSYTFNSSELQKLSEQERKKIPMGDPKRGGIKDGEPGARADQGTINYAQNSILAFENENITSPIVAFYHEMVHAWNGANGTFLPGTAGDPMSPGPANGEPQAVGLPTNAPPFDFDNDPTTPPTSTNPAPFTENALREEMGLPPRMQY